MTKQRDDAERQAYDQGRHARAVSIGRDQSPLVEPLRKDWQEGWDFEDGLRGSDAEQAARAAKRDADRLQAEADAAKAAAKEAAKPAKKGK